MMFKKQIFPIISLSILALIFSLFSCQGEAVTQKNQAEATQVTLAISGMMCENGCGAKIKKELTEIDGVDSVFVDFKGVDENNQVAITYNSNSCSPLAMKEKIEKIGGGSLYQVTVLSE